MSTADWMRSNLTTQGYCLRVTATNLCLPSEALSRWERRTIRKHVTTT